MEVFNVNSCSDSHIDLKSFEQLESLLNLIKDSQEVMIKWEAEDEDDDEVMIQKFEILITDNLMARIKDGRFRLTASKEKAN